MTIYLDNQATTPTDPRVLEAMVSLLGTENVGNPHSEHIAGHRAAGEVELARTRVAGLIGALPEEIIFTSGATEANNIAIQGIMRAPGRRGDHIITCSTEHKSVLETVEFLSRGGCRVDILPVGSSGVIDISGLESAMRDETAMVSIMSANNEVGVIQPIEEIAALCRARGIVFHTDAAQAVGKIELDSKTVGADLISISGHKIYAPIGIGALYISNTTPVNPEPITYGGGQERGLRAGTLASYLCAALGKAAEIASAEMCSDAANAADLRARFLEIVKAALPSISVNGDAAPRLPGNLSLTIRGVDADRLVGTLQPLLAISTNSACNGGTLQPSHVLIGMGLSAADADCTVRIGFGRFNTVTEVEIAAQRVVEKALQIRRTEGFIDVAA